MDILLRNQSESRLKEMYEEDYYWYLKSQAFKDTFLKPLAVLINQRTSCLDVGCGEGQLAEFVNIPYHGIDASKEAIEKAKAHPGTFEVARAEEYPKTSKKEFNSIVFGGILHCLVHHSKHLDFLKMYEELSPEYFFIYDLYKLDTGPIQKRYTLVYTYENTADIDIHPIKKHRRIEAYKL